MYYKIFSDYIVITYDEVAYCSGADDGLYTFQVILHSTGKVEVNYKEMIGLTSSATIGIQNGSGSIAQQVVYNNGYVHNDLKLVFNKSSSWLEIDGDLQGQVFSGDAISIDYTINTDELVSGNYSSYITIASNAGPTAVIPVNLYLNVFDGILGDTNEDGIINVSDIILMISFILNHADPTSYEAWASDLNDDGLINVVDIVVMIDIILGNI